MVVVTRSRSTVQALPEEITAGKQKSSDSWSGENKTIYVQMRVGEGANWFAIEEIISPPIPKRRRRRKKVKTTTKRKNVDTVDKDYMKMPGNWRVTKLDLPELPSGYGNNVVRRSAVSFGSRIYLFGGLRFPPSLCDRDRVVSDVIALDVRTCEWIPSAPLSFPQIRPSVFAIPDDGETILFRSQQQGITAFVPPPQDTNGCGYWKEEKVLLGGIPQDYKFNVLRLFSSFRGEVDNSTKLLLYCASHLFLIQYDYQSNSVEHTQHDFGRWHGDGVVLFHHYMFCFGVPGKIRSGNPRSLYGFNLRNLNSYSKVLNLPKPDEKRFPFDDHFSPDQLVCLLKIDVSNDTLVMIWNTMTTYTGIHLSMLRLVKFTIAKSHMDELFEANILSTSHCVVDGSHPINCLAMSSGPEEEDKFVDREGQQSKKQRRI